MAERLQKIISAAGIASRRAAESLIEEGRVTVNGERAYLGQTADTRVDIICVNGKAISKVETNTYIMLNKPRGYVTTLSDEKGRKTVADLVKDAGVRLYPVGRLDMETEGLLIMTDDGELANRLMHPSNEKTKVYEVTAIGKNINSELAILRSALEIDGYKIVPAKVDVRDVQGDKYVLNITIKEGRNRQIRKMCDLAGLKVRKLRRIAEDSLGLGQLRPGQWRYLTENEIHALKKII